MSYKANVAVKSEVNSKIPSQAVNMTAAASGSSGIKVADNDNIDFGTGNFTLVFRGILSDWTPSSVIYPIHKQIAIPGYFMGISATTGKIRLGLNTTVFESSIGNSFVDNTIHEITNTVSVGAANTTVTHYIDGIQLGSAIVATNETTVSNTESLSIMGSGTTRYAGNCSFVATYNRALSAAEVLSLYNNGIDYADKWGNQTAIYTSDFSVGVDSWSPGQGTADGNIDSIGGLNDWIRYTCNSTAGVVHRITRTTMGMTVGKKYRLSLKYYIPSTNSTMLTASVLSGQGANFVSSSNALNVTNVATTYTIEWTCQEDGLSVYGKDAGAFQDPGGDDVFYIKDVVVTEIGATLALEPEGIQPAPGQWLDSSSNKLHALHPAAGSSLIRQIIDPCWMMFTTGTSSQYIAGGATRALFPSGNYWIDEIYAYSTGTPTFTMGDSSSDKSTLVASKTLTASTWTKLSLVKNSTTADDIYVDITSGGAAIQIRVKYHLLSPV